MRKPQKKRKTKSDTEFSKGFKEDRKETIVEVYFENEDDIRKRQLACPHKRLVRTIDPLFDIETGKIRCLDCYREW